MAILAPAAAAAPYHLANSDSDTDTDTDHSEGPVNSPNSQHKIARTYEEQQELEELDNFRIKHYSKRRKTAKLKTGLRAISVLATLPVSLPLSLAVKVFGTKLKRSEALYLSIASTDRYLDEHGSLKLRRINNGLTKVICRIAFSAIIRNFTVQGVERSFFLIQESNCALDYILREKTNDEIKRKKNAYDLVLPLILESIKNQNSNPDFIELLEKSQKNAQKIDISKNENKINETLGKIREILKKIFPQKEKEIPQFNSTNSENAISQLFKKLLEDTQFEEAFKNLKSNIPLTISRNIGYPNEKPITSAQRQEERNSARAPLIFASKRKNAFNQSIITGDIDVAPAASLV